MPHTAVFVGAANDVSLIDTTITHSNTAFAMAVGAPTQISIHNSAFLSDYAPVLINGNVSGEIDGSVLTSSAAGVGIGVQGFDAPVELHIAHTTIRGFNQGVQVSGVPYASVSISHSELTNNVVAAHADNGGLLAMEAIASSTTARRFRSPERVSRFPPRGITSPSMRATALRSRRRLG